MATGNIAGVPVEIFAAYIIEKLRKVNPHLECAFNEDQYVLGGSVVHIPQAGAGPNVVKNRNVFPASAVRRGDSFVTYALDVFTSDPTHITWREENEISYNKTDSVLNDHVASIIEAVGDHAFYNWIYGMKKENGSFIFERIPDKNILRTTGEMASVNSEDGQTGQRRIFTYKELQEAQARMNKAGVPVNDRFAALESYMYFQFIDSLSQNQMAAFQGCADLSKGIVGEFAGFKIMQRGSVLAFQSDFTPVMPGEVIDSGGNLASFLWQKDSVARAKGDIKPFQDIDNPTYYGDIFSALVKFGGRCRRADWNGVIAIVQATQ